MDDAGSGETAREPDDAPGVEDLDLTREHMVAPGVTREPIPYEERTRRVLMVVLGGLFLALTALQVVLALTLTPDAYQPVSAALSGSTTVLAAGLGGAIVYYFTRPHP